MDLPDTIERLRSVRRHQHKAISTKSRISVESSVFSSDLLTPMNQRW